MSKVIFRCDGASLPEIGTGHVVRSLALADNFTKQGVCNFTDIIFATKQQGPFNVGAELIKDSPYPTLILDDEYSELNSEKEVEAISAIDANLVVFDKLTTDQAILSLLKTKGIKIVSLDDSINNASFVDCMINAILHSNVSQENVLTGYQYLILPLATPKPKLRTKEVKRILVSFGGYDHNNLSRLFLESLSHNLKDLSIDIVVGSVSEGNIEHLRQLADAIKSIKISIYYRPKNFYSIMEHADMAIVSGGITLFQCLSCGIPTIAIPQYQHQQKTIENLQKYNALLPINLNMKSNKAYLSSMLTELIKDPSKRRSLSEAGQKMIDKNGINRVTEILRKYVT